MIAADATVDGLTILIDSVTYVMESLPIGGFDNPLTNAFVHALFERGGKQLLARPDLNDVKQIAPFVVDTVGSCDDEIVRPDREFGARFEQISLDLIARHPLSLNPWTSWARGRRGI